MMRAFGQELNPESHAICKADMLIKGQDVSRIKLGNTLSNEQLPPTSLSICCRPPFGVDWKRLKVRSTMSTSRRVLTVASGRACRVSPMARCYS